MSSTTDAPVKTLKLMVLAGGEIGKVFLLEKSELSIGRDPSSDIHIEDSRLSHHHARVMLAGKQLVIEDLNSTNGTFVNSKLVEKTELNENDVIKIGRTLLTLTTASDITDIDISRLGEVSAQIVSESGESLSGQSIQMALPQAVASFENAPQETGMSVSNIVEVQRKLFLLYRISKDINVLSSLDDLCEMILRIIFNEVQVDRGVIMLLDKETGEFTPIKTRISSLVDEGESSIQVSETIVKHALETQKAVLTENAMEDRRFFGRESIVMLGVRSVMCVPLISKEDVFGMIYVDKLSMEKIFTRNDLEFLTAICNQAALSISNTQLFEEVKRSNEQLKTLNTQLLESNEAYRDANEKLQASYKKLEETQQRLVQSEKLSSLGRLVAGIAHDLKNILMSVNGYAHLLMICTDESKREDLAKKLSKATDVCTSMVKDLLSFARQQKLEKEMCNLNDVVNESVELASKQFEDEPTLRVETELTEPLPPVKLDQFKVIRAFTNIITNGMQAMRESTSEGMLTIRTSVEGDRVRIIFSDTGPGIPEEDLLKVFDPFFSTKKEGMGTGLGLSLCHGIITGHGGDIWAESEVGKGATFIVELTTGQS